jgi:hypothetical protein
MYKNVSRTPLFLIIVSTILVVGLVLSFYGAQITTKDLAVTEFTLQPNETGELEAELDPALSQTGVFVVQGSMNKGILKANVLDPFGTVIVSEDINTNSFEKRFEIISKGKYHLEIVNLSEQEIKITGVLGHMPDTSTLSIGLTGFYLLVVGLFGVVGVGIYIIRNRKKAKFS